MQDNYENQEYEVKRGGRPARMDQKQLQLAMQLYFRERMSLRDVADALHVSHMTIWRVLARVPAEEIVGAEWMKAGASM